MDDKRSAILGEIAAEAGLERASFLNDAAAQFVRFLESNRSRIAEVGGLVLIDEDPDYLSVAPDGTFRSRSRYQDEATGEWVSETEVIESGAELVELYNPAELYAAFREARIVDEVDGGVEILRLNAGGPADRSVRQRILSEVMFFLRGAAALLTGRVKRSALVLSLSPSIFCVALGDPGFRRAHESRTD